jgi:hypothetical protein
VSNKATENVAPPDKDLQKQILLEQYRRCAEDWRKYDAYLWQIPFSTFSIVGVILALVIKSEIPEEIFRLLMAGLVFFVITMMISSWKTRFFQDYRAKFAEDIERRCGFIYINDRNENQVEVSEPPILKIDSKYASSYLEKKGFKHCELHRCISAYHLQIFLFIVLLFILVIIIINKSII